MPPRVAGISRMPGRIRPERVADFVGIRSEDIKATGDPAIAAIACRTLNDLLHGDTHDDLTRWKEEIDA